MQHLSCKLKQFKHSSIILWALCFLATNLMFREYGATNEMSRYATLRAMTDQLSFNIDSYVSWTVDWSRKDGHYYSNKAPGPMLIGFPLFLLLDQLSKFDKKDKRNEQGHRITPVSSTPRVIMSLLLQIIPFIVICLMVSEWLQSSANLPNSSLHFFAISVFFANTAAIFMNTYFGHGMSALLILALTLSLLKDHYFSVGLFFGLALLCEYSVALVLLPLLLSLLLFSRQSMREWITPFVCGGLLPGFLWCLYHYQTMGSIFQLPTAFQNPRFIESTYQGPMLWGVFAVPSLEVIGELLFGQERGLLVTQPWVLIVALFSVPHLINKQEHDKIRQLSLLSLISLMLAILLNSSFNGWHGGATSGPRYLAFILPTFSILGAYLWANSHRFVKALLTISLGYSVIFRILVYGSRVTAPEGFDLWPWLMNDLIQKDGVKGEIRAAAMTILLGCTAFYYLRKNVKKRADG